MFLTYFDTEKYQAVEKNDFYNAKEAWPVRRVYRYIPRQKWDSESISNSVSVLSIILNKQHLVSVSQRIWLGIFPKNYLFI